MQLAVEAYVNERQHITLELVGNMPGSKPAEPASSQPPDAAEILENIRRGVVAVHADRAEVTKKQLQVQMNTIRRNAVNHGTLAQNVAWSTDCDAALMAWLQSKKRWACACVILIPRCGSNACLASTRDAHGSSACPASTRDAY
jgi:hypothetical protein